MSRFKFINYQKKTVQLFNFSVNFKEIKKVDLILETSLDFHYFFDARYVIYQLTEIKDDNQVVYLFPFLSRHPVLT